MNLNWASFRSQFSVNRKRGDEKIRTNRLTKAVSLFCSFPLEGGKRYHIPNLFEGIVILLDDKPRSKYIVVLYLYRGIYQLALSSSESIFEGKLIVNEEVMRA